ncbi:hypothetical protein ACFQY0_04770 [Haloferula chungangensis]|uniref:Lipoprotein n=1 Tax=Haloferula chungangensis TaxID=1048331 RepID=A0ABW2L4R3_9BACT
MKAPLQISLVLLASFSVTSCIIEDPNMNATQLPGQAPSYGGSLSAEKGNGAVTIRQGGQVVTSVRTAAPNVEQTSWYAGQEQIVVKSRGNHGPATVELFNSRTGAKLGTVMAYEAASGPAWARSMAE